MGLDMYLYTAQAGKRGKNMEEYAIAIQKHVDTIKRELLEIRRLQKRAYKDGFVARCDLITQETKIPAAAITAIGVDVKEYPTSPAAAEIEQMLNRLAELASNYVDDPKQRFNGKCPYTGKTCKTFDCENCDVDRAERELVLKK